MGYILLLIAAAIGGAVTEIYRIKKMTDAEYLDHEKRFLEHAKGLASGIVIGAIGTTAAVIKKSDGHK